MNDAAQNPLLKSPESRLIAHALVAGLAVAIPLLLETNEPLSWAIILGALGAGARVALGLLFSTNPQVGVNIL